MHVTFDTATRQCLAGTNVTVGLSVTTAGGTPVDEYDLHVGAELRVAGRKVTLRKALTLATLSWLDQQARSLLVAKYRLEEELNKFRPVVPVPGQYCDSQRAERFDLSTHQHLPAGGRLNLRALHNFVMGLADTLRGHRAALPRLPEAVSERLAGGGGGRVADWSPDRWEAERREAEARAREALLAAARMTEDATWRHDIDWLNTIPLASSCSKSYARELAEGKVGSLGGGLGGGLGGLGGGAPAGGGKAGERGGRGGSGPLLAFSVSMTSRHGGGGGSRGDGGGGGGGGSAGAQRASLAGGALSRTQTLGSPRGLTSAAAAAAAAAAAVAAGRGYGGPLSLLSPRLPSPGLSAPRPGSRQRAG